MTLSACCGSYYLGSLNDHPESLAVCLVQQDGLLEVRGGLVGVHTLEEGQCTGGMVPERGERGG